MDDPGVRPFQWIDGGGEEDEDGEVASRGGFTRQPVNVA